MPDQTRELRRALLLSRAAVERMQLTEQWNELLVASRPSALLSQVLPAWVPTTGQLNPSLSQAWAWVRRYRMVAPLLTMWLAPRTGRPARSLVRRLLPMGLVAWLAWQGYDIWRGTLDRRGRSASWHGPRMISDDER